MTRFRVHELSGVDKPAQQGATVAIMKRAFSDKERQEMADKGQALPDGSFPIATEEDLHNAIRAIGRAKDEAKAKAHIIARAHAMGLSNSLPEGWVSKAQGAAMSTAAEIRKSLGLPDSASETEVYNAMAARVNKADAEKEEAEMAAKKAKDEAEKTKKDADMMMRKASMTDMEKDYCEGMSDDDMDKFMSKTKEERAKMMAEAKKADDTLTVAGTTIRKSVVGAGPFAILKAQQDQITSLTAGLEIQKAAAETATFMKRAQDEMPYLPGTLEERAAVLKSIEAMPEAVKATQMSILKAANATAKYAFEKLGKGSGPKDGDEGDVEGKIKKKAEDYQKANPGVSFAKASEAVMMADPALYDAYNKQQRERAAAVAAN
jgi:hypothetical protein